MLYMVLSQDYQQQIEELFINEERSLQGYIQYKQQIEKDQMYYFIIANMFFVLGALISIMIRFALINIQKRKLWGCKISNILYILTCVSVFGYYFCQHKCSNYQSIKNIIQYYQQNKEKMNDGNDMEIFVYGTNMFVVRCYSFFLASLYVAIFIQSDLQLISQKNAYKGAFITAIISLIIGWLIFQGQQVRLKKEHVSIIKDLADIERKAVMAESNEMFSYATNMMQEIENQQFVKMFSSLRYVIIATIESLIVSIFIIWKIFTVINLQIGKHN